MAKMRRIVLIQEDLYEQIRAMAQGDIDRYQRKSCTFSKKPWRVTKAQRVLAQPVKQRKLGKASHLQAEATARVRTHGGLRLAQAHVCQQPQ